MNLSKISTSPIPRHKAALRRKKLSRPVVKAIEKEIITKGDTTIFDYGCGYGTDTELLSLEGYSVIGRYDPYYFPSSPILPADVVFLSFVLSVIEDLAERERTLLKAYHLAEKYLVVGFLVGKKPDDSFSYSDGIITKKWGTFERFYNTNDALSYLKAVLGVKPIRLDSGIYAIDKLPDRFPPPPAYQASDSELTRTLSSLRKQKYRLKKQGWIPSPKVFIQVYSSGNNDNLYFRLRSPKKDLLGKNGLCYSLHLGNERSCEYQEAVKALERRDKISLIDARIDYISQALKEERTSHKRVVLAPCPTWIGYINRTT